MGWLNILFWAATALAGAVLISEAVSYFLDVPSIRQVLRQKIASGKLSNSVRQFAVENNDGHKVTMSMLANGYTSKEKIELYSNQGVSSSIKKGMIIDIDD